MKVEVGRTIKYYRIKHNMTQAELADGICSIPHLSKIENSIYNANHGTAALLLERLGIDIEEEYAQHTEIEHALEDFIEAIQFVDEEEARKLQAKLLDKESIVPRTIYINTYHLYMMRYYLMIGNASLAFKQWNIIDKNRSNLSAFEELTAQLFYAIYLIQMERLQEAKKLLLQIQNENVPSKYLLIREIPFVLANYYTLIAEPEKATIYAKDALHVFKQEDNYIRAAHSQMLLGINYTQLNMVDESLRLYKILLRNTRLFGLHSLHYQAMFNYGVLLKKMECFEKSHQCFQECIAYYETGSKSYVYSLLAKVEVLFQLNIEKKQIRSLIEEVIQLSNTKGFEPMRLKAKYYFYRLESSDEVYSFIEQDLLPYFDRIENTSEPIPYAIELAKWYQKNGQFEKANEFLTKYVADLQERELSLVEVHT